MPEEPQGEVPNAAEEPGLAVEIEKEPVRRPPVGDEELGKLTAVSDDEIARANDQAKKAVKGLRTAYQEQRRRAEQWSRDAATASNLADQLYRENQALRQSVTRSESALIDQALTRSEAQVEHAKTKFRQAQASGDADLILAATEEMTRAVSESDRLKLLKPAPGRREPERDVAIGAEPGARPPAPPAPNARTNSWVAANPWFGYDPARHDVEMTQFAMRQHQHLALDGVNEETNPELYWRTIEQKLVERYPEKFNNKDSARPTEGHARPVAVTGATRSNGAPSPSASGKRTVRLTETQVRLAARLGITPEQYAVQLVLEQQQEKAGGKVQ